MSRNKRNVPKYQKIRVSKRKPSNSTPGKTKGGNCVATPIQRTMAKRNRSWKHDKYGAWCLSCNSKNNYKG